MLWEGAAARIALKNKARNSSKPLHQPQGTGKVNSSYKCGKSPNSDVCSQADSFRGASELTLHGPRGTGQPKGDLAPCFATRALLEGCGVLRCLLKC